MRELDRAVALAAAVSDAVGSDAGVIAAGYADGAAAQPPAFDPQLLPALVRRSRIAGALIDTLVKDGRGLYEWLSPDQLDELAAATRAAGGSFGVAGQLRPGELTRVAADIVGVRSAACRGGDRSGVLATELVAAAVAELRAAAPVSAA